MSESRAGEFEVPFGDRRAYGAGGIWYGIAPESRRDVDEWMGREHLPQLVGRPGGWRGRRFHSEDGDDPQAYFGLYDVRAPAALLANGAEAEAERTEWTDRMVPYFHDLEGGVFVYTVSSGSACGGSVATVRFQPSPGAAEGQRAILERVLLDDVGRQARVASAHLLEPVTHDPTPGDAPSAADVTWLLLVEAVASDGVEDALAILARTLADGIADGAPRMQRWRLMYMLTRA